MKKQKAFDWQKAHLMAELKLIHRTQIESQFGIVGFGGEAKTGAPLEARSTNNTRSNLYPQGTHFWD